MVFYIRYVFLIIGVLVLTVIMWGVIMLPPVATAEDTGVLRAIDDFESPAHMRGGFPDEMRAQFHMWNASQRYFAQEWLDITGGSGQISREITDDIWNSSRAIESYRVR